MSSDTGQLPLALRIDRHACFDSFVADGNNSAIAHLTSVAGGERHDLIWLWGLPGSGKSHLLQASCRLASESGARAMYLNLDPAKMEPEILSNLDSIDLLAIDDLQNLAGDAVWEAALFSLVNARYAVNAALLMAAEGSPSAVGFRLPDLASRAAGSIVYRLKPLNDESQLEALMQHAAIRGLEVDASTAAYLFKRVQRDMRELVLWLDRIDREALIAQRRITVPFVRALLEARAGDSE